jgi:hypothetical protein
MWPHTGGARSSLAWPQLACGLAASGLCHAEPLLLAHRVERPPLARYRPATALPCTRAAAPSRHYSAQRSHHRATAATATALHYCRITSRLQARGLPRAVSRRHLAINGAAGVHATLPHRLHARTYVLAELSRSTWVPFVAVCRVSPRQRRARALPSLFFSGACVCRAAPHKYGRRKSFRFNSPQLWLRHEVLSPSDPIRS